MSVRNLTWLAALLCAGLILSGCDAVTGEDDDDSSSGGGEILIATASGGEEDASGTWEDCVYETDADEDVKTIYEIDGGDLVITEARYDSATGDCDGTETESQSAVITGEADSTEETEWSDNSDAGATPPTGLGGDALDGPIDASVVKLTLEDDTFAPAGTVLYTRWLIDDTGGDTEREMYRGNSSPEADCSNENGDDLCLFNTDQMVKQ